MSVNTTNYGFVKPDPTDIPDITVLSRNWDVVDFALKLIDDRSKITTVDTSNENINTYTEQGIYLFDSHTPTGVPSGCIKGWLLVIPWKDDYEAVQLWIGRDDSNVDTLYVRNRNYPNWTSWKQICTDVQLDSLKSELQAQIEMNKALVISNEQKIKQLRAAIGSPLQAATASAMTDTTRIYVYTGSEPGYTAGNWYGYDGTAWVSGGVYNSTAVETDKTLTIENMPADAKATGDELTDLKSALYKYTGDKEITATTGAYIPLNGTTANISSPTTSENSEYAVVPCVEGDTFTVSTSGGKAGRAYGFISSDGTILQVAGETATITNQILVAPENTAYLIINAYNSNITAYYGEYLVNKVDRLINVTERVNYGEITDNLNVSDSGVTVVNGQDQTIAVYGTATAIRHFGFLNGQQFVKTSSNNFEKTLDAGTYLIETHVTGPQLTYLIRGTYSTFQSFFIVANQNAPIATVTFTAPVMLAFTTVSNTNYGTSSDPTIISFTATQLTAKDIVARRIAEDGGNDVKYVEQTLTGSQKEVARKNIDSVGNDDLYLYNSFNALIRGNGTTSTKNGIDYTRNDDGTWTINGTASALSFGNIINSQNSVPRYIIPGRKYRFSFNGGTVPVQIFVYRDGSELTYNRYYSDFEYTFPRNMSGLIVRFYLPTGSVVNNETVNYTFVPEPLMGSEDLYRYNFYNILELGNVAKTERNYVTYVNNNDGTWTINGTASKLSWGNIVSSINNVPPYIIPGRKYKFSFNGGSIPIQIFIYKNGDIDSYNTWNDDFVYTFPLDMEGVIIRFEVLSGITVNNETVRYTFVPCADTTKTASVLWLGDSISRGRLGAESANASVPIPNKIAEELNIVCENFGIGDIGWCAGYSRSRTNHTNAIGYLKRVGNPDYYDPGDAYNGYKFYGSGEWSDFNTIVLAIGTNDTGYPLGSLSDIDDTLSYAEVMAWKTSAQDNDSTNRTIVKAMYQCYRFIRESEDYHAEGEPYVANGKHMNIIISDPIISGSTSTGTPPLWGYTTQRSGGYTRLELNQLYADFAQKYGCGHITNYDAPIDRIHLENSLPDGVHPNEATYQQLGRHFAGKISALVL